MNTFQCQGQLQLDAYACAREGTVNLWVIMKVHVERRSLYNELCLANILHFLTYLNT